MIDTKITIEFKEEIEHLQDFNIYHTLNSKEHKRVLLKSKIFLSIFCFIMFFSVVSISNGSYTLSGFFKALILSGFICLLAFSSSNISREKQIRNKTIKFLNKPENRNFLKYEKLIFDANGIYVTTDISESSLKWDWIVKVASNDEYFFLYVNSMNAIVIPKSAFTNDLDKQLFIKLLNKNTNG
jgi:hypothetical protein